MVREDVARLLCQVRTLATHGRRRLWKRHRHTLRGLAQDGLRFSDIWRTIQALEVSDYSGGPRDDPEYDGQVWVFGPWVREDQLYVRLRIGTLTGRDIVECQSFHTAERPLRAPFR